MFATQEQSSKASQGNGWQWRQRGKIKGCKNPFVQQQVTE